MFSPSKLHSPHGRTDIWKAQELERTGVFPSCKMLLSISDAQNLTYQVFPKKNVLLQSANLQQVPGDEKFGEST